MDKNTEYNYLERIIAKVMPRYYFLITLASILSFTYSCSFKPTEPELFGVLLEHQNIESKLDSLDGVYNQPLKINNLADKTYFNNLEKLKNSLLSQKDYLEFSYEYMDLRIEYDLQKIDYTKKKKKYDWIQVSSLVIFGLSVLSGMSSWKDRSRALENKKSKETSHSNK